MERLLEKIVENTAQTASNTDPKSSFFILVDNEKKRNARIKTKINPVIELDKTKKYEMGLVDLYTYYVFPNIDESNNNFRYSPNNGATWFNVDIPEGSYELEDINNYLKRMMKENSHYDNTNSEYCITLEPNTNTLKAVLTIATNYEVDLTTANSIRSVLGFDSRVYKAGYNESENIVNIMSVDSFRVTSDIIGGSYSNGTTVNVIYSFFPSVGPGYKIIQIPANLIYLPVTTHTISSMDTRLTDQNGKLINMRGEAMSIKFHIREV